MRTMLIGLAAFALCTGLADLSLKLYAIHQDLAALTAAISKSRL